jgi:hypothetical protein
VTEKPPWRLDDLPLSDLNSSKAGARHERSGLVNGTTGKLVAPPVYPTVTHVDLDEYLATHGSVIDSGTPRHFSESVGFQSSLE